MKRKIFSIILAATLIISMFPAMTFAETETVIPVSSFSELTEKIESATSDVEFILTDTITADNTLEIPEDKAVTINLDIYDIELSTNLNVSKMINVCGELLLKGKDFDIEKSSIILENTSCETPLLAYVSSDASLVLEGVAMTKGETLNKDCTAVHVASGGAFKINYGWVENIEHGVVLEKKSKVSFVDTYFNDIDGHDVEAYEEFSVGGKIVLNDAFLHITSGEATRDVKENVSEDAFHAAVVFDTENPLIHSSEIGVDTDAVENEAILVKNVPDDYYSCFGCVGGCEDYVLVRVPSKKELIMIMNADGVITNFIECFLEFNFGPVDSTEVYILKNDIDWLGTFEVPEGRDVTIYMNGYDIKKSTDKDATFFFKDQKLVFKNGPMLINNGRILIRDGAIVNANSSEIGGAIVSNGETILKNVTIKDNKAVDGAGILVTEGGSLTVGGKMYIYNNRDANGKQNNIVLDEGAVIGLDPDCPLAPESKMGITALSEEDPVKVVSAEATMDDFEKFVSDSKIKYLSFDIDHFDLLGKTINTDNDITSVDLSNNTKVNRTNSGTYVTVDVIKYLDNIVKEVTDENSSQVVVTGHIDSPEYIKGTTMILNNKFFEKLGDISTVSTLVLSTNIGEVTLNKTAIKEITNATAGSETVNVTLSRKNADESDNSKISYSISVEYGAKSHMKSLGNGTATVYVNTPEGLTGKSISCLSFNNGTYKARSSKKYDVSGYTKYTTKDFNETIIMRETDAAKLLTKAVKPTLRTVKAYKGKKAKVTFNRAYWDSVNGKKITKYQVYRSTSKNFNKNLKKYTVNNSKSTKTISFVNKKLTKGKTYYYKVRGIVKVNGSSVYTKWSSYKKVKAK